MNRALLVALIAALFVVMLASSPIRADDTVPTTVPVRPNPTEATILSDVDVFPVIGATAGILGLLTVVAVRREWI